LNVNEAVWQAILDQERKGDQERGEESSGMIDDETDEDEEDLEEELDEGWGDREFVSDVSGDEADGLSDLENAATDDSVNEEGSSEDEDGVGQPPRETLGKRKATSGPTLKPSRRRPEKKKKKESRVEVEYEVESVPLNSALSNW